MNGISFNSVITSITAKADGSLGLRVQTPELTPEEKVVVMNLQNVNTMAQFRPLDTESHNVEVKTELTEKTPSERLRNAIFRLYALKKEKRETEELFDTYYRKIMEGFIQIIKTKMEDYE